MGNMRLLGLSSNKNRKSESFVIKQAVFFHHHRIHDVVSTGGASHVAVENASALLLQRLQPRNHLCKFDDARWCLRLYRSQSRPRRTCCWRHRGVLESFQEVNIFLAVNRARWGGGLVSHTQPRNPPNQKNKNKQNNIAVGLITTRQLVTSCIQSRIFLFAGVLQNSNRT